MSEATLYEVTDGIAWLTINRPEARNALGQGRPGRAVGRRSCPSTPTTTARVLVITGAGDTGVLRRR